MARVGLVLGAGGVAGGAWHAGALVALASATGWDVRTADVVVGTSAGSIAGAGLRSGLSAEDEWDLAVGPSTGGGGWGRVRPPLPFPASPLLGVRGLLRRRPRPGVVLAGLLPAGTLSTSMISSRVEELFGPGAGPWPEAPLWVVAVDLASGRRVVFGRDDAGSDAQARVGEAVAASCAVPSFFSPVTIGGRRYVDGGVHSPTNADLVAGLGLDLVVVSAPMAGRWRSLRPHPAALSRTAARVNLDQEVAAVRRSGTPVLVLQPGPDDTPLMDGRAMDPSARIPIAQQARRSVAASLERPSAAPLLELLHR